MKFGHCQIYPLRRIDELFDRTPGSRVSGACFVRFCVDIS